MTQNKIKKYKEKLLEIKRKHEQELALMEQEYQSQANKDLSGYSIHLADSASETYEREKSVELINNISKIISEVNDALEKIERGEYGKCEECKGVIDEKRLDAIPYARLCINCQRKKEQK